MSDQCYSAELIFTKQDFADVYWKSTLVDEEREGYSSMWQASPSAARKALEDNRSSHGKVRPSGQPSQGGVMTGTETMLTFELKMASRISDCIGRTIL